MLFQGGNLEALSRLILLGRVKRSVYLTCSLDPLGRPNPLGRGEKRQVLVYSPKSQVDLIDWIGVRKRRAPALNSA